MGIVKFLTRLRRRLLVLLPVLTALVNIVAFFVSYGITVGLGYTEPGDFPYISNTAVDLPARAVFAQLVNIGALFLGVTVVVRYLMLREAGRRQQTLGNNKHWRRGNVVAMFVGVLSALGLSMVANFQMDTLKGPHFTGAGLALGLGTVYCWIQTALSWRMYKGSCKFRWTLIQLVSSIVITALLIIFAITKVMYKVGKRQGWGTKWDSLRGTYLTSTITEWLLTIAALSFGLTFVVDFWRYKTPRVIFDEHKEQSTMKADPENANGGGCDTNQL